MYAEENTVSTLGRFVLIIWLFVVLILNSSYIASLTSILTVEQLSSQVKGIESLIASKDRIGFPRDTYTENYLTEELHMDRSRLVALNSMSEFEKALKDGPARGGVAAIIDERAYMELFLATRCEFSIVGPEFTRSGWGFVSIKPDGVFVYLRSTKFIVIYDHHIVQMLHTGLPKGISTSS